jgi:hypothetical protein
MRYFIIIITVSISFIGCKNKAVPKNASTSVSDNNKVSRNLSAGKDDLIEIATVDIQQTLPSMDLGEYEFASLNTFYYPIAENKTAEDLSIVFNKKGSKRRIPVSGGVNIEHDSVTVWYSSHESWRQGKIFVSNAGEHTTTVIFSDKLKQPQKK